MNHLRHLTKIGGHFTAFADGKWYSFVKSSDIPRLLNKDYADIGFVGSDKLDEANLSGRWLNMASAVISSAQCSLVVASAFKPVFYAGCGIVTSYPNLTRRWIDSRQWPDQRKPRIVFEPSGSVEAYVSLGVADTIVDIRESGKTLVANNLDYYQEIEPIYTKMIWRQGDEEPELKASDLYAALSRIAARKTSPNGNEEQTTTDCLLGDRNMLVKKIGSEAAELVQALVGQTTEEVVDEAQDLVYAIAVALASRDQSLTEVLNRL